MRTDSGQSNTMLPLCPTVSGLQSVPSMYSHAEMPYAVNSLMSFPSTPYSLSRMNSDINPEAYGGTLTPRVSRHLPAMGWDPSLCQLQRAPDSISVLNGSIYEAQGGMQPLMLPLQRVSSHQAELVRRTSLLSRNSQQKSPLSDGNSQLDTAWVMTTPQTILSVPSVQLEKPEGINSEVCFGDYSENESNVMTHSLSVTSAEKKPVRNVVRAVETVEPSQPVLPRVLSNHGEGDISWMSFDPIRSMSLQYKGEGSL